MTAQDITGPRQPRLWTALATVGLLAVMAGTLMPIINFIMYHAPLQSPAFKYVYAAGAVVLLVSKIMSPYKGKSLRVKRLYRLETWTPILFCAGVFFLFYEEETRDWIAFTLAGGALMAYTSIMIPIAMRKELRNLSAK